MELWDNIQIFKIGLLEMPPQLLDLFFFIYINMYYFFRLK